MRSLVTKIAEDEITISFSHTDPSRFYRGHFQSYLGVDYTCSICSLPATVHVLRDSRLTVVQNLDVLGDDVQLMLRL